MHAVSKNFCLLILCLLAGFTSCLPLEPTSGGSSAYSAQADLVLADRIYKPSIHTVQLYPATNEPASSLLPAVTSIRPGNPLLLTFDDLIPDYEQYQVRLIHCDWTWQQSRLTNLEFLHEFNDFPITDYTFSQNTRIPYVHYEFEVPPVKLPGNYVLVVFRNNNPNEVVLSKRFMVYSPVAQIQQEMTLPAGSTERRQNQQIDFTLDYNGLGNVLDPASQFRIVIRKNQRWDNAIFGLKPTGIREGLKEIEYRPFDKSNQFKGGNEYRFFDLRMVQARGQNVGEIIRDTTGIQAFLVRNKPRTGLAYSQTAPDLNGQYQISNVEYPNPDISSEYVDVHFFLETDVPLAEPVYVAGEFSNYLPIPPYLMRYDVEAGGYLADILLKQGWYNYLFLLKDPEKAYTLENSFSETENQYEIIVYFRPAGEIYDTIVGYAFFKSRL